MVDLDSRPATLRIDGKVLLTFATVRVTGLGAAEAADIADLITARDDADPDRPPLVVFERASPDGRRVLRDHGISYAGTDGEALIVAPPVYVERPRRRAPREVPPPEAPFAPRASRIPRWLLLNPDERPTFRVLAARVALSEATVSRALAQLEDDGVVRIARDTSDGRVRRAVLSDAGAALDRLEGAASRRPQRRVTLDVGAQSAGDAEGALLRAAQQLHLPYAVGGLAGARRLRRVVEPADVWVWVRQADLAAWQDALLGEPARPAAGRITLRPAADPFTLTLAHTDDGLSVADPVQLYLDCRIAGERAIDAARAIREQMGW